MGKRSHIWDTFSIYILGIIKTIFRMNQQLIGVPVVYIWKFRYDITIIIIDTMNLFFESTHKKH